MTDEIAAELQSELVALQAVLMSVFRRMAIDQPEMAPLLCRAFDEAEIIMSGVAVKLGFEGAIGTTTGALRVLEELRSAVIQDPAMCHPQPDPQSSGPRSSR